MTTKNRRLLAALELEGANWKKSSYSGGSEGQCVEVADLTATPYAGLAVRDSKNPTGPALLFDPATFAGFISDVQGGKFDI
ncbi:DUF397 domain-containing protein [Streptomyces sp. ET3-23]|uniref:DUF397 domain-containing protein n=1 Tax=Streptomyces sp. ET3-23 TaxID=2885643 RepID=UPI001D10CAC5|nr:DUF397 domain-containing protein [Streptomyces sp. ET3-23]MCC2275443.1 DUF397 domain-containing protein [Streptomyces sp. ET3-23]